MLDTNGLRRRWVATLAAAALLAGATGATLAPATAVATPPDHAKAHGWRKKNDPRYAGYTGAGWEHDYGVRSGRCNTDDVLAAVGAVAGGVIGNRTASDGNRTVATIVGAVVGGVLGAKLGDAIDDRDRACIGHSLELADAGRAVLWTNPSSGIGYTVKPLRDLGGGCREFELAADRKGRKQKDTLRACRDDGGQWVFRSR